MRWLRPLVEAGCSGRCSPVGGLGRLSWSTRMLRLESRLSSFSFRLFGCSLNLLRTAHVCLRLRAQIYVAVAPQSHTFIKASMPNSQLLPIGGEIFAKMWTLWSASG